MSISNNIYNKTSTCSGCAACANICPVSAILMVENNNGYYTPIIDNKKCINCGKCIKVCPEINLTIEKNEIQEVFACQADDEIRMKSSSGGMFTIIATEILSNGGYVVGAAFDKDWNVCHKIINSLAELDDLRRSKYVQSFISENLYKKIQTLLNNKEIVLFTGCPCQVAGLKKFLSKEYDNLFTIDLLCAHAASPKAYREFLKDNFQNEKIQSVNFRSKIRGWDSHTVVVTDKHKEEEINHNFMRAFVPHLLMNEPCKKCKYHNIKRMGDFTIGDFWGIGKRFPSLDDRKGTSCLLINSAKANTLFNCIKKQLKLCEQLNIEEALKSNHVLKGSFKPHRNIEIFNKNLGKIPFNQNVKDCMTNKHNVAIMGWFWVPNRGAILTNYALNEYVKSLGYQVETINFIPNGFKEKEYQGSIAEQFANKYLNLTNEVCSYIELKFLNAKFSTFIAGSDQLWRWKFRKFPAGHLFLNFVEERNKKISYSTSFGVAHFEGPEIDKIKTAHWLSRFDAISVREDDAEDLLQNTFNITGKQVMDPVFLIDKEKYETLINTTDTKEKDFIAYYFIADTNAKMKVVEEISKKYGVKSINIKTDSSVEEWLYYIKNAKYIIADSFHAVCFAIIFNKPFLALNAINEVPSRFNTILSKTNLMNRFLYDASEFSSRKEQFFDEIDWDMVNSLLKVEIERSKNWLINALNMLPKNLSLSQKMFDTIMEDIDEMSLNNKKNNENLKLLLNQNSICRKYYRFKILSKVCFGKKRTHYKEKSEIYHEKVRKIRKLTQTV